MGHHVDDSTSQSSAAAPSRSTGHCSSCATPLLPAALPLPTAPLCTPAAGGNPALPGDLAGLQPYFFLKLKSGLLQHFSWLCYLLQLFFVHCLPATRGCDSHDLEALFFPRLKRPCSPAAPGCVLSGSSHLAILS